jgi:hypothetical protein
MAEHPIDDPDVVAGFKAGKQTSVRLDFDLEDIIAGNTPEGELGRQLDAIVANSQDLPTQSKIEDALIPLYEAMAADFYRQEGGTAQPPTANRQNVREHAVKVLQARKVKRTALLRAARDAKAGAKAGTERTSRVTRLQLVSIGCLAVLIIVVLYLKS